RPRRRQRAYRTDERVAGGDVVLRARAPVHVLRAEIAQRLLQTADLREIANDQRQRGLEVPLQYGEILREQPPEAGRGAEEPRVEPRRQLPIGGRDLRVAAP